MDINDVVHKFYEFLKEREWTYDNYLGVESHYCQTCGASAKKNAGPLIHKEDCEFKDALKSYEEFFNI
jgi:hypothetical protein